jgi:hypothetical protein
MANVDDLLQSGSKQIVLAVVAWLAHGYPDSESRRRRNHEPPKSGIPKRKKTATHNRLSCKIEYLLRSNYGDGSIASEFFTGDSVSLPNTGDNVQAWAADDPEDDDLTYIQMTCLACAQAHLVNPKTGKVLGSDDE